MPTHWLARMSSPLVTQPDSAVQVKLDVSLVKQNKLKASITYREAPLTLRPQTILLLTGQLWGEAASPTVMSSWCRWTNIDFPFCLGLWAQYMLGLLLRTLHMLFHFILTSILEGKQYFYPLLSFFFFFFKLSLPLFFLLLLLFLLTIIILMVWW